MAVIKVLVTVKTYPTLSKTYDELVCTAGFKEDGSWIRIYPIPFRKLDYDNQYKKWQWIELNLVKNKKDFRPESYRPYEVGEEVKTLNIIDTKDSWSERKKIVLRNVCTSLEDLIVKAKNKDIATSLGVVKPKEILDFYWKRVDPEWDPEVLREIRLRQKQGDLFSENAAKLFSLAKKVPYEFTYRFTTEDGKVRNLMIEDWEIGMLYWNCLESYGSEEIACQKVKEKYFDYMYKKRDLYFFVGTTQAHQIASRDPFIIIGTFTPPKVSFLQKELF